MPDWIDAPPAVFFGGIILTVIGLARPRKLPGGLDVNLDGAEHARRAWALVALGAVLSVSSLLFL
jgi:hypothetical protein